MSETKFGAWTAPQGTLAIEYSLVVIEEIRQAVTEGFQRFARGGIEVGGVLYGTYDGQTARVLAVREIACEHARGPSFILSDKDRVALAEQLERDRGDPRLEGFTALGLYVSHTRSEIVLLPTDQETYEAFFPELSQVALVVRPGRAGAMRAGFFVREADGTVKTERSYLDFDFPDRVAMPDRSQMERSHADRSQVNRAGRERPLGNDRRGMAPYDAPAESDSASGLGVGAPSQQDLPFSSAEPSGTQPAGTQASGTQPLRAPEFAPYPDRKGSWMKWGIAAMVVLAVAILAVIGLRYFGARPPAEPISLAVYERDGQLRIEWSHQSALVRNAARGTLEIVDGKDTQTVTLGAADLLRGSFTYARRSGDVQVRLEVQNSSGDKAQEASRFLGTPPRAADANELDTVQLERDTLKDEATRLRTQNAAQAERIQQLERTLTILRARLGIATPAAQ